MIINVGDGGANNAEQIKYNDSNVAEALDSLGEEVNDIKEAFQDGCNEIVSGITAQGVTPSSNSPADIVAAVNSVATNKYNAGVNATKVGTAVESQVLKDKTFTNSSGVGLTGNMPNNGAVNGSITTSGGSYTIPQGYHNGGGKVTGPTLANLVGESVNLNSAGNLLSGVTAYGKNGNKYTGSMANKGAWTNTPTDKGKVTIPSGYHNGSGYVDTNSVYEKGKSDGTPTIIMAEFRKSTGNTRSYNISSQYEDYQNITINNILIAFDYNFPDFSMDSSVTYDNTTGLIKVTPDSWQSTNPSQAYVIIFKEAVRV